MALLPYPEFVIHLDVVSREVKTLIFLYTKILEQHVLTEFALILGKTFHIDLKHLQRKKIFLLSSRISSFSFFNYF